MKKFRKTILLSVAALTLGGLSGCDFFTKPLDFTPQPEQQQQEEQKQEEQVDTTVHVEDLTINPEELDLVIDEEKTITLTISPESATNKAVTFKSSKPAVATVSDAGVVKGIAEGTAIITVQSVDNAAKFRTCVVSVKRSVIHVTDVVVGETLITITPGSDSQLTASVQPADATNKNLIWQSNNAEKVTVDQEGHIHGVAIGEASITVQSEDNPLKFKTFTVKVEETVVAVTGVELNKEVLSLEENAEPEQLVAAVSPNDASNKALFWTSSNQNVATVGQDGTVTPVKTGNTIVKVKTMDGGFEDTVEVTITKTDVTAVTLSDHTLTFSSDATGDAAKAELTANIDSGATYKNLEWSSQDESVATVTKTGANTAEVHMVGAGTTVITVLHENSRLYDTCVVTVVEPLGLEPVLPISRNNSYQLYEFHRQANPSNKYAEFNYRNEAYEVGDDNKINLKPYFTLEDEDENVVEQNAWAYPFKIDIWNVTDNKAATDDDVKYLNTTTCDIQFNGGNDGAHGAVGKKYKVTIKLGGLTEEQYAAFEAQGKTWQITAEYDLLVVDGYNVTNEYELGYLDSDESTDPRGVEMRWFHYPVNGSVEPEEFDWYNFQEFKTEHNLKLHYNPATLVLHKDLRLTKSHLPSSVIFSQADAELAGWDEQAAAQAIGSLRDDYYFYGKYNDEKTTLSGNYFTLDWSAIPLVKRSYNDKHLATKVESHTCLLRIHNGEFEIKNINFIGNAHTANSSTDIALAGGLIGFKVRYNATKFEVKNVLGHGCYMTFMNEGGHSQLDGGQVADFRVNDSKFFDNYNVFLYNWGGKTTVENTMFEGCGGPVVVQDHVVTSEEHENGKYQEMEHDFSGMNAATNTITEYSYKTYGKIAETTFIDCEFKNYVLGTEAWFVSFGAEVVTPSIKDLCDLVYFTDPINARRSAIYDSDHNPSTNLYLSDQTKPSLFNFIVINKSGRMPGLGNFQVSGEVNFKHRIDEDHLEDVDSFNYLAPETTNGETVDLTENATLAAKVKKNVKFRTVGSNNAPIVETAGGVGYFNPTPGQGYEDKLIDIDNAFVYNITGNTPEAIGTDIVTNAHQFVTIYYMGMMLVMSLGTTSAPIIPAQP